MDISELSNRFIKEPSEVVKAAQIASVKVLKVDIKTRRIALSMKALMGSAQKCIQSTSAKSAPPSLDEKLALLSTKWKVS